MKPTQNLTCKTRQQLADEYGVNRTTFWRWVKKRVPKQLIPPPGLLTPQQVELIYDFLGKSRGGGMMINGSEFFALQRNATLCNALQHGRTISLLYLCHVIRSKRFPRVGVDVLLHLITFKTLQL